MRLSSFHLARAVFAAVLAWALVLPVVPVRAGPPGIGSPSAILIDAASGRVLFEKDPGARVFPASTTKIMTMVVALEAVQRGRVALDDAAIASPNAAGLGGTQVFAAPGESFPLSEWLAAVAIGSANDASVVVAEHIAGSEEKFVAMMNQRAVELGMTGTRFTNPHGLHHDDHYTTARDLAILARHAVGVPGLLAFTRVYRTTFRQGTFGLDNFNRLVRTYPGADGLKTGRTSQSGFCLVATAKRDHSRFIAVAMGAESAASRNRDIVSMLDYAFANYRSIPVANRGQVLGSSRVFKGVLSQVDAIAPTDFGITVDKGEEGGIEKHLFIRAAVAPVIPGQVLGEVVLSRAGKELGRLELVASQAVARRGLLRTWTYVLRAFLAGR